MRWTDKFLAFFGLCEIRYLRYWVGRCTKCEKELAEEKATIVKVQFPKEHK